jgi:hypothetical protein
METARIDDAGRFAVRCKFSPERQSRLRRSTRYQKLPHLRQTTRGNRWAHISASLVALLHA